MDRLKMGRAATNYASAYQEVSKQTISYFKTISSNPVFKFGNSLLLIDKSLITRKVFKKYKV